MSPAVTRFTHCAVFQIWYLTGHLRLISKRLLLCPSWHLFSVIRTLWTCIRPLPSRSPTCITGRCSNRRRWGWRTRRGKRIWRSCRCKRRWRVLGSTARTAPSAVLSDFCFSQRPASSASARWNGNRVMPNVRAINRNHHGEKSLYAFTFFTPTLVFFLLCVLHSWLSFENRYLLPSRGKYTDYGICCYSCNNK